MTDNLYDLGNLTIYIQFWGLRTLLEHYRCAEPTPSIIIKKLSEIKNNLDAAFLDCIFAPNPPDQERVVEYAATLTAALKGLTTVEVKQMEANK